MHSDCVPPSYTARDDDYYDAYYNGNDLLKIRPIIGIAVTGALWSIASWRLVYHMGILCCKREGTFIAEGMTMKRAFHISLWISMTFELIAYLDLANIVSLHTEFCYRQKIGYALYDIIGRGIFEFTTFAIGTTIWFQQIAAGRAIATEESIVFHVYPFLLTLASIVLAVSATNESARLLNPNSMYHTLTDFERGARAHRAQVLVESAAWSLHGLVVTIGAVMLFTRIAGLPTYSRTVPLHSKLDVILKMIGPMMVCCICFFLRASFLFANYVDIVQGHGEYLEGTVKWWIGNIWVPTVLPGVVMLYSTRRRDRSPGAIEGISDASLIPEAIPPQEAFLACRRMVGNEENGGVEEVMLEEGENEENGEEMSSEDEILLG